MAQIRAVTPSELTMAQLVVPARPRPEADPRTWAERHPVAATLEDAAPGPELVATLASLVAADVDDAALLEGVAAWERVAAWAAAQQAALVAERTRRATGSQVEFVADEVAARLAVSGRAAGSLVERAAALEALPELGDALAHGALDLRKADVLVRETRHLPAPEAREVVRAVLDDAPTLTAPALREAVRRAEVCVNPAATEHRHRRARRERCVRMTPAPSSMAWLSAYLPAADATTVMTALDAVATRQAPEDDRTTDARRADALTDLMRKVLDTGTGPDGPLPTTQRRRPHLMVTASAASLAQALSGARRARRSTPRDQPDDDGVDLGRGVTDRPDATDGPDATDRPDATDGPDATGGSGTTYCGALAELAGYGPIPIEHAMSIAAEADWRVAGIDPATGELRGRSSRSYRPSPHLTALVLGRDRTCTFLGCRIPAERCDIDHVEPFDSARPPEDQTREQNLQARCRHHHRMKTHGGWSSTRDPATGDTLWTSPTGRTYRRPPAAALPNPPAPRPPDPPAPALPNPPAPRPPDPRTPSGAAPAREPRTEEGRPDGLRAPPDPAPTAESSGPADHHDASAAPPGDPPF